MFQISFTLSVLRDYGRCWLRLQKGREIPLDEMKSLTVGVAVGQAHHAKDQRSNFGHYTYLTNATDGKNRGMESKDGSL